MRIKIDPLWSEILTASEIENMELYTLLSSSIESSRDQVQRSANARSQSAQGPQADVGSSCVWRGDAALAEVITNIKNMCLVLSSDFTKLVLVGTQGPSADELGSLLGEIIPHVDAFGMYFTSSFVVLQSVSSHLFQLVYVPIKVLLNNLVDLTNVLKAEKWDEARKAVGAVIELCENTIVRLLPATNKVAYRRALLDKAAKVADVYDEFDGYVRKSVAFLNGPASAAAAATGGAGGDGDGMEEDSDDDEGTYTSEELVAMRGHCELLRACKAVLKVGLAAVTEAADSVHPLVNSPNASAAATVAAAGAGAGAGAAGGGTGAEQSVTQANATATSLFESNSNPSVSEAESRAPFLVDTDAERNTVLACRRWAYRLVSMCELLDVSLVDYGADLYSPLEEEQVTRQKFESVKGQLGKIMALLQDGSDVNGGNGTGRGQGDQGVICFRSRFSETSNAALDELGVALLSLCLGGAQL